MSRKTMLITMAAVALGIAEAVSSAQAADNQSATAAHAATKDREVKGANHLILTQRSYYEGYGRWQSPAGPFNPNIGDDFEGYPHPQ